MRNALLLALSVFSFLQLSAQERCGTAIYINSVWGDGNGNYEQTLPTQAEIDEQLNAMRVGRAETIIVPIVFHVLHDNGAENISDDQILDALRVLNEDFNAENADLVDVISSFEGIIGDAEIEFRLATKDEQGNPTTGIDRIESDETYVGDTDSRIQRWDGSKYLNIWVSDVITVEGAQASAFSTNPVNDPQETSDGIIANHRYLGTIGTAISDGHTLGHEVGHYLSLNHTWGPSNFPECDGTATNPNDPCFGVNNCDGDDGVSDTPLCIGTLGGCNLSRNTCNSLDNIQNFMDYANCDVMFTEGQAARLRAALNSTANAAYQRRRNMVSESNLAATGVTELTIADYRVESYTACRGESVQFFDASRYDPETWSWEVTGPATFTSNVQNPTFIFKDPGYYTVSLTVTQGGVTETITEENAFYVSDVYGRAVPFEEDFAEPEGWVAVSRGLTDDQYGWLYNDEIGYDDNASYFVYNIGNDENPNVDELILSSVDFRPMSQVNVSFKVAYARLNSTDFDQLSLAVSNDCGQTWLPVWSAGSALLNGGKPLSSSIFEPSSQSDWESFTVTNIPTVWLGPDALLKFTFSPGGGNHLYLDNINVSGDFTVIPYLVYPTDNAVQMNNDVVLDWRAVVGASSYEYQVSKNAAFTSNVASGMKTVIDDEDSGNEDTRFQTSGLENGTEYFWRIRAKIGTTNTEWSDVWSFTVADDGVGIAEQEASAFTLYPNPTADRLNVRFSKGQRDLVVHIYAMDGRRVGTIAPGAVAPNQVLGVDVTYLANGIYTLEAVTPNKQWNQRFIINR